MDPYRLPRTVVPSRYDLRRTRFEDRPDDERETRKEAG